MKAEIDSAVVNIIQAMDAMDSIYEKDSLEGLREFVNGLMTSQKFFQAKNELMEVLLSEMDNMNSTSQTRSMPLYERLKKTKKLSDVIDLAAEMSSNKDITRNRGMFGSFSLFENPIKIKLREFSEKYKSDSRNEAAYKLQTS